MHNLAIFWLNKYEYVYLSVIGTTKLKVLSSQSKRIVGARSQITCLHVWKSVVEQKYLHLYINHLGDRSKKKIKMSHLLAIYIYKNIWY